MTEPARPRPETRVLLLAPTAKDAAVSCDVLTAAGRDCCACADPAALCAEIGRGAGAAVLAEEALSGGRAARLVAVLKAQPRWSDLPVIVLTAAGPTSPQKVQALLDLGNVTLLKRPLEVAVFLNAV